MSTDPGRQGFRAVLVIASLIFLLPACWLIGRQVLGTHATAEVIGCDYISVGKNIEEICRASWKVHGRRVTGILEGASGYERPGQHIAVTVHGHSASSHSIGLPLILLGLGLVFAMPLLPGGRRAIARLEENRRRAARR